jgi:hypothetical protein
MRLSPLTYKVYRASTGASAFWRWEVRQGHRKAPLKSGYAYGTMADAKQCALAAMSKMADNRKMRSKNIT